VVPYWTTCLGTSSQSTSTTVHLDGHGLFALCKSWVVLWLFMALSWYQLPMAHSGLMPLRQKP
jgi:hypothetical protein